MGARENLQRLLDKKTQEIEELERQLEMARVYVQAIQDSIKALPREVPNGSQEEGSAELRSGTLLARAREALEKHGAPMHISEILKAIGVENTKRARVSLVGSLGAYVRKRLVFTRPGPNIFGLVGMKIVERADETLPIAFGQVTEGV